MKELDLARRLHDELDNEYAKKLFNALAKGHTRAIKTFEELRRINDGAYFLIVFATFERQVNDRAIVAVRKRALRPHYRLRRAWETLLDGNKLKTSFMNKVRLILDKTSADFVKVQDYYKVRNDLAHTGVTNKIFNIPGVVSDLKAATRQMKL